MEKWIFTYDRWVIGVNIFSIKGITCVFAGRVSTVNRSKDSYFCHLFMWISVWLREFYGSVTQGLVMSFVQGETFM